MNVPFNTTASDYTGSCTRPNLLIQRICAQITTGVSDVIADTYSNRSNYTAAQNQSALFVATDQNVIYQSQVTGGQAQWTYVSGIIWGPATALPTLSATDVGVLLLTQSSPYEMFRWDGSDWVNVTPSGSSSQSGASGSLARHAAVVSSPITIVPPSSGIDGQQLTVDVTQPAAPSAPQVVSWGSGFIGTTSSSVPLTNGIICWFTFTFRQSDGIWHLSAPAVIRSSS
jgi:hypothetical protein